MSTERNEHGEGGRERGIKERKGEEGGLERGGMSSYVLWDVCVCRYECTSIGIH